MANNNNKKVNNNTKARKVVPIKVEKIVDVPNNSKKEVFAIVVGILLVAALVVSSVIYFKGKDNEPLTNNPNHKDDDTVDVLVEPTEEEKEDKKEEVPTIQFVSNVNDKETEKEQVVKKECKSCSVVVLETYDVTASEESNNKKVYNTKNELSSKTYYYTSNDETYIIEVKGTLKNTKEDIELVDKLNKYEAVKDFVEENEVTAEELVQEQLKEVKDIIDEYTTEGVIYVTQKGDKVVTHTFTIRIEEKEQVDWSKGVTVNGVTYTDTVLNQPNLEDEDTTNDVAREYTYQDEDGINIVVGVNKDQVGEEQLDTIKFDVMYTTKDNNVRDNSYEVDLTDVKIEYELETDKVSDESEEVLGEDAVTEEDVNAKVENDTQLAETTKAGYEASLEKVSPEEPSTETEPEATEAPEAQEVVE